MRITFLSVDGWRPENADSDTVSLLIDGHVMVDTGWHPVRNLLKCGTAIRNVDRLLLTHLHQDHRMGLPALLFYLLNSDQDAGHLEISGVEGVEEIVRAALSYAGKEKAYAHAPGPGISVLRAGERLQMNGLTIETAASHHAVPGLMYRFTDSAGCTAVYTGDTAPSCETVQFAHGADILIHEHSWGAVRPEDHLNACCHSSAEDAARCARDAGVKRLYLVHSTSATEEESLMRARAIFSETYRPASGDTIVL